MDKIPFQPNRFATAASHYLEGRPAYAAALIARVAEMVALRPEDRLLDLGCGPGQLARAFAPYVREAVGVDPEPEMLRVAGAASADIANISFRQGSSYDLGPDVGAFRMVCMGRSFHWMDRADTVRRLDAMLPQDGAVVLFSDKHPRVPDNAWRAGYSAVVERYAGDDAARAIWKSPDWVRNEGILLDSPFSALESVHVWERRAIGIDTLLARALSMSSTSLARLGARAADMTAELTAALPATGLREVVVSNAVIARRPRS